MTHKKQNDLPGWFPFAVVASGLVMIGAGIRSNWGRPSTPAPTVPPVQQGGVLQDWFSGDYRI